MLINCSLSWKKLNFFYRYYAHKNGYEFKITVSCKHARNNELSSRYYVCKKVGRPIVVKNSVVECDNDKIRRQRDSIQRILCKVRIFVVCRHLKFCISVLTLARVQKSHFSQRTRYPDKRV